MHIPVEYELKFLNLDIKQFKKTLLLSGGEQVTERVLLRRYTFDPPQSPRGTFIRVRDDGKQVTLTYKEKLDTTLAGMKEIEEKVEDFDKTVEILTNGGLKPASYEENYRELYKLGDASITIDTWPGIPSFVEVETGSETLLKQTVSLLGLSITDGIGGTADEVYQQYGITIVGLKNITFQSPPRKILE